MKKIITGCDENGLFTIRKRSFLLFFLFFTAVAFAGEPCKAVTKSGQPCKGVAQKGTTFCVFHNPANRCEGVNAKGAKCGGMKMRGTKFCKAHQNQAK